MGEIEGNGRKGDRKTERGRGWEKKGSGIKEWRDGK